MAWPPILVRYGEIGIKSRSVRINFERRLMERLEEQLLQRRVEAEVTKDMGRLFVRAADVERAVDAARHTFGVVSVSPAVECAPTPDAISQEVLAVARERLRHGQGFATRVKRAGQHSFTSLDVAKACAERILTDLADRAPRVDLDAPDLETHVEVRDAHAYVYTRTERGPGGLPLGSQGRVAILADSPRAAHVAWLMGKRGSTPYFFATDVAQAERWIAPLAPWVPERRVRALDAKDRAGALAALAPEMPRHRLMAVVVADGAEDAVRRAGEDQAFGFPVFRPLVGYPGERFRALAREAELPEGA